MDVAAPTIEPDIRMKVKLSSRTGLRGYQRSFVFNDSGTVFAVVIAQDPVSLNRLPS